MEKIYAKTLNPESFDYLVYDIREDDGNEVIIDGGRDYISIDNKGYLAAIKKLINDYDSWDFDYYYHGSIKEFLSDMLPKKENGKRLSPQKDIHLIYLFCHLAKHLYKGGAGIRMYMDIALFIKANSATLDFEKIYGDFDASPKIINDEDWRNLISELEYLDGSHKELFLQYSSDLHLSENHEKEAERALAYFIFRHCTSARDEGEYRAILIFCLFLERLFASVLKTDENSSPETLARIISEEIEYSEDNTESLTY